MGERHGKVGGWTGGKEIGEGYAVAADDGEARAEEEVETGGADQDVDGNQLASFLD